MKETNEPSGPQHYFRSYTQNVQLFKQKPSFMQLDGSVLSLLQTYIGLCYERD